ncbi:MAG: H-NS histone family protein [Methylococcales bacterium]|nr:H-NS histone family protein [Methylococcales bacterium]
MTDLTTLSETELQAVIDKAEKVLKDKQITKRKEVIVKIKELAASIGVIVDIQEGEKAAEKRTGKVAPRYRNPSDPSQTWTGRGLPPKWLQSFINSGHVKSEFEIK